MLNDSLPMEIDLDQSPSPSPSASSSTALPTTSPLRIVICGAGIAGLGAAIALALQGHRVIVVEAASQQLSEIGAGIQIPPNSTRILDVYGLTDKLRDHIVWPRNIALRRYADGWQLGLTPLHPQLTERYGYPYSLIHRADYQRVLFDEAVALSVRVLLAARVVSVDQQKPSVTTADGREVEADVVVGADGIRSKIRDCIFPDLRVLPTSTANCAFRATVPVEDMMADPQTARLMTDVNANAWIGPDRHVMGYPIRQGAMYNLVMCHPGQAQAGEWSMPGDVDEMKATYADFDPVICKVISQVSSCLKWTLADLPPLPTWLSESGRVVLIGDAAHAMVPFLAQGASMGIEDGACLAECLGRAASPEEVPRVLKVFERVRKPRCERIQLGSRANGDLWHLQDGPEQEVRDRALEVKRHREHNGPDDEEGVESPNPWSDKDFQPWLFGYNVFKEVHDALDQM